MPVIVDGSTVVLSGTVGEIYWDEPGFSAAEVSLALAQVGHDNEVLIRLNSDGGIASEGAAIHAAIARHAGQTRLVIEGVAASAASLVAMAADEIIMAPGSIMMIHDPATFTFGNVADHEQSVRYLTALVNSYAGIYAARSGRTLDQARQDMGAEVWFAPEEAVAAGYADRVGNDQDEGGGAEIIEFPERVRDPIAFAVMRHAPTAYRNAPEPLRALASANGRNNPRSSQAAHAVVTQRQEPIMTNTPQGGGQTAAPATEETNVVDINAARQDGRTQALAYFREVNEICQLAGQTARATAFIESETSLADVRTALLQDRAKADADTSITNAQPGAKPRFNLTGAMSSRFGVKKEA